MGSDVCRSALPFKDGMCGGVVASQFWTLTSIGKDSTMRKPLALFAAASLSAGVLAFLGYDNSVFGKDDQQKSTDVSGSSSTSGLSSSSSAKGHASLPQGTTKAEVSDEAGIRATLRQVTIAAVKDDSLSD